MRAPLALLASLALALAGCGDGGTNATNAFGPLTQIPAPNNGDWTQIVSRTPEGTYLMGNPDAPVKLVEYASATCHVCADFSTEGGATLRDTYVRSGQVSWEYRPYLLFPSDPGIFLALRCLDPAAFFRTTEQIYADQHSWITRLQSLPPEQQQAIRAIPHFARGVYRDIDLNGAIDYYTRRYVGPLGAFTDLGAEDVVADIGTGDRKSVV